MSEITFIITEDHIDGGYTARAHWADGNRDIITEGDTRDDLLRNIREAVEVSFDSGEPKPELIHLHFVRDEVIAR
jgi:predicted RNase H-like HicB family nuclease